MALLRCAALLAAVGCVDTDLRPRQIPVELPAVIETCAQAAEFGRLCGAFEARTVDAIAQNCLEFGNEPWTTCALSVGRADCAQVAMCAFGGTLCDTSNDCNLGETCTDAICVERD